MTNPPQDSDARRRRRRRGRRRPVPHGPDRFTAAGTVRADPPPAYGQPGRTGRPRRTASRATARPPPYGQPRPARYGQPSAPRPAPATASRTASPVRPARLRPAAVRRAPVRRRRSTARRREPPAQKSKVGLIAAGHGVVLAADRRSSSSWCMSLQSTVLDPAAVERDVAAQFQEREGVAHRARLRRRHEGARRARPTSATGRPPTARRSPCGSRSPTRTPPPTPGPSPDARPQRAAASSGQPSAAPSRLSDDSRPCAAASAASAPGSAGRARERRPRSAAGRWSCATATTTGARVQVVRGRVHLLQHGGGQRRLRDDGPRDRRPDAGQVAELVDQRRRGLGADAGDAGQPVARVTAEDGEVGVGAAGDAVLGGHRRLVDQLDVGDAAGGVEHPDAAVVVHELEQVAVAGDDVDRAAGRGWPACR